VGAVAAGPDATWSPDFKVTALSSVMSLMPAQIIADLGLVRYGYRVLPMGPTYLPFPARRWITLTEDPAVDHAGLCKFSASTNARRPLTGVVA
jgi:hypothetical protein